MNRPLSIALAVVLSLAAPSPAAAGAPLGPGEYVVEGRRADGSRYHGVVTVEQDGDRLIVLRRLAGEKTAQRVVVPAAPDGTGAWVVVLRGPAVTGAAQRLQGLTATGGSATTITLRGVGDYLESATPGGSKERWIPPAALEAELQQRYGTRPRVYAGLFDGSNEAERRFLPAIRTSTGFINGRLAEGGYALRVDMAMLATNFITEGGFRALDRDRTDGLNGFRTLGIDTIVDSYGAVRPWLHPSARPAVEDPANRYTTLNEKGQTVTSVASLTLEEGVHASAAMFAMMTAKLERDLRARGIDVAALDPRVQFFWTTVYFNAGPGAGAKLLDQHGLDYARRRWTGADDHRQSGRIPRFNATWRTEAYDYLSRRVALPEDATLWTRLDAGP